VGADISPDGRFVAFLSDRDGEYDLWLSQVGTGQFRNITSAIPPLDGPGGILRSFGFAGDGSEIWFKPKSGAPMLIMPLIGGPPRAFLGVGPAV